jgi:hypothetical protein
MYIATLKIGLWFLRGYKVEQSRITMGTLQFMVLRRKHICISKRSYVNVINDHT